MTRTLADALLPPEHRHPPRPRKPYLPAGAPITCVMGHAVGTVAGDIPRRGSPIPPPRPLVVLEQPYIGWDGRGGRLDCTALWLDTLLRAWRWERGCWPIGWRQPSEREVDVLDQPIPRGRCRICDSRFFRFIVARATGEPHAYHLHTPMGWGRS